MRKILGAIAFIVLLSLVGFAAARFGSGPQKERSVETGAGAQPGTAKGSQHSGERSGSRHIETATTGELGSATGGSSGDGAKNDAPGAHSGSGSDQPGTPASAGRGGTDQAP